MQESKSFMDKTIGAIVAEDYRTAKVFERYGIDFCCGGKVALSVICHEKDINPEVIISEIDAVRSTLIDRSQNYEAWPLAFLCDYIVNTHHAYLYENTEQIAAYLHKIVKVHGPNHKELLEIRAVFDKIANDIMPHLREEENTFFPAVKRVETARKESSVPDAKDLETIKALQEKLRREHEEIGDAVHRIHHLSGNYTTPADACNTFSITYQNLREFEDDLHKHVHLENNILFQKIMKLINY